MKRTNHSPDDLRSSAPPRNGRATQGTVAATATARGWSLDPLLTINGRWRFEHRPADVARAWSFIGPIETLDAGLLARAIVMRVHERMRVLPTAFGMGMPKTLPAIVEAGGGNCVSHAVLAAVLLRNAGFPTRLVRDHVYTNFSWLRVPALVVRAPVGPTLNSHVWIETLVDGAWQPADAELGLFGSTDWLRVRVVEGVDMAWGTGVPIRERWRFPLSIHRLGSDGAFQEAAAEDYLVDKLGDVLGRKLPATWVQDVHYFSRSFVWEGRAGLRIMNEWRRLKRMSQAVSSFRLHAAQSMEASRV